ncbi:MAG: alpha/beta fold hydrolase, partial [Gemmatimonadaceae bacterium]
MTARPLSPAEMYPASAAGVSARMIELSTQIRVRVAECGPSTGLPLVLLHGWGASLYTFRHAFERMPLRGFRVIAADLRGFGLSDKPARGGAYSFDAYAADLEALLGALGLERAVLGGHSMGGGLALHFTLTHPERVSALALINPTSLVPATAMLPVRAMPTWMVEMAGRRLVPRWVVGLILARIAYGDASRVTARDIDEYWAPTQLPGYVRAVRRTASDFNWTPLTRAEAATLSVPATVVLGASDRLVRHAGEP